MRKSRTNIPTGRHLRSESSSNRIIPHLLYHDLSPRHGKESRWMDRHLSSKEGVVNPRGQTRFRSSCSRIPQRDRREQLKKNTLLKPFQLDHLNRHPRCLYHQIYLPGDRSVEKRPPTQRRQPLREENRLDKPTQDCLPPGSTTILLLPTSLITRGRDIRSDAPTMRTRRQMVLVQGRVAVNMDLPPHCLLL
jgi:hypothetical protein